MSSHASTDQLTSRIGRGWSGRGSVRRFRPRPLWQLHRGLERKPLPFAARGSLGRLGIHARHENGRALRRKLTQGLDSSPARAAIVMRNQVHSAGLLGGLGQA